MEKPPRLNRFALMLSNLEISSFPVFDQELFLHEFFCAEKNPREPPDAALTYFLTSFDGLCSFALLLLSVCPSQKRFVPWAAMTGSHGLPCGGGAARGHGSDQERRQMGGRSSRYAR